MKDMSRSFIRLRIINYLYYISLVRLVLKMGGCKNFCNNFLFIWLSVWVFVFVCVSYLLSDGRFHHTVETRKNPKSI